MSKLSIKDLSPHLRPREKMVEQGPKKLSIAELLAILFNSGSKKESVLQLAKRIVESRNLEKLRGLQSTDQIQSVYKVTEYKAVRLLASVELGRRLFLQNQPKINVTSAKDILHLCEDMKQLKREELRAFFLDNRNVLIAEETISVGSGNMLVTQPRDILCVALEHNALKFILVHNHPSGNSTQSDEDLRFTRRVERAAKIMGIELLDHLVIGAS